MNKMLIGCAAVALAFTASAFDEAEKAVARELAGQVETALKSASALDGKAITLLPVRGDSEGYFGDLLLNAAVKAGKTCVIANDAADERFARILKDIKWDERQTTLKSVDPSTVDELGKLKSTQIFLEASLSMAKGKTRVSAEVLLRAYAVETKQYVWVDHELIGDDLAAAGWWRKLDSRVKVDPAQLRVKLSVTAKDAQSGGYAKLVEAALTEGVIASGCTVGGAEAADVVVAIAVRRQLFDRTGDYLVFDGAVDATVDYAGTAARRLGERKFQVRGVRALGDQAADRNLANATSVQVNEWATGFLDASALGFQTAEIELQLGAPVREVESLKAPEAVRQAAATMAGVRSAVLVKQDDAKGVFTYRIVYDAAQYPGGFMNALFLAHPELEQAFAL